MHQEQQRQIFRRTDHGTRHSEDGLFRLFILSENENPRGRDFKESPTWLSLGLLAPDNPCVQVTTQRVPSKSPLIEGIIEVPAVIAAP